MKRLLVALAVAALLAIFTVPALAQQGRPSDPSVQFDSVGRIFRK
ncbi:MAG TPA: hypothetical protein VNT01_15455 [Symbiobacteriaceae bacterium]|nr:hypothetical protein [Symbiobacteriaceae bacterium]